jgi:hypothetical protein
MLKIIYPFLFASFFISKTIAQSVDPGEIQPDRPGLGEATSVVPKGFLQIESGGNFQWDRAGIDDIKLYNLTYNSTFVRIGLFDRFELRLNFGLRQDFFRSKNIDSLTAVGFMPWGVGFKSKICEQNGLLPRTSFLASLQIPYPSASFLRTKHLAPYFLVPMEWDLSEKLLLTGNIGMFWNGNDANHQYFSSLGVDYILAPGFGVFVEGYMYIDDKAEFIPSINGGLVWLLMPNLKIDISSGLGLNKTAPNGFINAGISVRLPN